MCDYTGHHFGAHYPDAQCIDGFLWDLDSYEDGYLTSGDEIACPACNMTTWLAQVLDDVQHDLTDVSPDAQPYAYFSKFILSLTRLHPPRDVGAALAGLNVILPHWGPDQDIEDDPAYEVCWPWTIDASTLSAHDIAALLQDASPKEGFSLQDTLWIRHA